jgi:hypothetical protein
MPQNDSFQLGEREFPISGFTIGELQTLMPQLANGGIETPAGTAAMATAIHVAVKCTAPDMTFDQLQAMPGVTLPQMLIAFRKIGMAIGYFQPKAPAAPGGDGGTP